MTISLRGALYIWNLLVFAKCAQFCCISKARRQPKMCTFSGNVHISQISHVPTVCNIVALQSKQSRGRNRLFGFWIIQCCILRHGQATVLVRRLLQGHQEIRKNVHNLEKCAHSQKMCTFSKMCTFPKFPKLVTGQRHVAREPHKSHWRCPPQARVLGSDVRAASRELLGISKSLFKN